MHTHVGITLKGITSHQRTEALAIVENFPVGVVRVNSTTVDISAQYVERFANLVGQQLNDLKGTGQRGRLTALASLARNLERHSVVVPGR